MVNGWARGFSGTEGAGLHIDQADVVLKGVVIGGCHAELRGAGIYNDARGGGTATLDISNSRIEGNFTEIGGGILNEGGEVRLLNSKLARSAAWLGGGACNQGGYMELCNSRIESNSADEIGGGIYNGSSMSILNCTLSGNTSPAFPAYASPWFDRAGAIFNDGVLTIGSTILQQGERGTNLVNAAGTVISLGFNLSSDEAGGDASSGPGGLLSSFGHIRNTDPLLGPLQDNAPTSTHALLPSSPALDQGRNFGEFSFDQHGRKYLRTVNDPFRTEPTGGDGTDIGAFERRRW